MGSEEQKRGGGSLGMGWGWILEYGKGEEQEDGAERERGREKECFREQKAEAGMAHAGTGGHRRAEHRVPGLTEARTFDHDESGSVLAEDRCSIPDSISPY